MPDSRDASGAGSLAVGDVISALFPEHHPAGPEQQGYRPAVVVGSPECLGTPRFELLVVVPITTDRDLAWSERSPELYPPLEKGTARLRSPSICLLDQVRAIGSERVRNYRGTLTADQFGPIHEGLQSMFSLGDGS